MIFNTSSLNTLKLIMVFVLFFPGFYKYAGLKIEQLITIIALMCCFFSVLKYRLEIKRTTYLISISYMFVYFFITNISLMRSLDDFVINDMVELGKPLFFLCFFLVAFTVRWNFQNLNDLRNFFLILCVFLIFFGYFESLTSLGNYISLNLYKPNRGVLEGKAIGPFIITYAFATFLVFPFYIFLSRYFFDKKFINKYLFLSFLTLGCIFLTQSKTVFLAVLISLLLFFLIYPFYSGLPGKRKVISIGVGVIFSVIVSFAFLVSFFQEYFSYIYSGLEVVFRFLLDDGIMAALNSNTSTRNRLEQLMFAFEHQDSLPLIGVGISKGVFMPESFYALYFYRLGLIGILLHFFMLFYSLKLSLYNTKSFIKYKQLNLASLFLGLHFYIISLPFCYFSAAVNDQTRTGFVLYLFIGINIATNKLLKSKYDEYNFSNNT
ncbi:hypothetical protein DA099_08895 [Photobacterium damselae]|uniref:Uncharacterized protein n=1 Tax=Photobacterium damselae TaxID=38293 RepID=A0ACD3SUI3_PHODM|nr:O-antigen ligase family protein [Photobacterium damselae]RDL31285.1 hypothetical protein BC461_09225 [Photobacterium damselae]TMX50476.1 hypothetical protein DA099_08895 [Photobacterium damselae]TMX63729.1 hypothetical protein DA090_16140 [Photobacterium damselae]TMX70285.1 hypothetical protein DA092_20570 [Photobacterium damselae]